MRLRQRDQACSFTGCRRRCFSKGLCRTHYWQQYVGRELTPVRFHAKGLTPKARFDRLWQLNEATGCWEWTWCHASPEGLWDVLVLCHDQKHVCP